MKNAKSSWKNSRGGVSSRESNGQFKRGTHWRKPQRFREREYLEGEYVTKKRSASEIAADFGVTTEAVIFWLRKNQIPRRTVSQARAIKKWGLSGAANGMHGRCGAKNPRWIDGSSPLRQTMYSRCFWKELAKAVYKRDGYKCVRCSSPHKVGNKLHAHHVKPWAGNPDARFSLSNIISLCETCHRWVHSTRNVNREHLA